MFKADNGYIEVSTRIFLFASIVFYGTGNYPVILHQAARYEADNAKSGDMWIVPNIPVSRISISVEEATAGPVLFLHFGVGQVSFQGGGEPHCLGSFGSRLQRLPIIYPLSGRLVHWFWGQVFEPVHSNQSAPKAGKSNFGPTRIATRPVEIVRKFSIMDRAWTAVTVGYLVPKYENTPAFNFNRYASTFFHCFSCILRLHSLIVNTAQGQSTDQDENTGEDNVRLIPNILFGKSLDNYVLLFVAGRYLLSIFTLLGGGFCVLVGRRSGCLLVAVGLILDCFGSRVWFLECLPWRRDSSLKYRDNRQCNQELHAKLGHYHLATD